jgi:hypothetical protein
MNDVISPIRDRSHERARLRIYSDMLNGDERDYEIMRTATSWQAFMAADRHTGLAPKSPAARWLPQA